MSIRAFSPLSEVGRQKLKFYEIPGYKDSQELRCQISQKTEVPRNQTELLVVSRWYGAKTSNSDSAKEEVTGEYSRLSAGTPDGLIHVWLDKGAMPYSICLTEAKGKFRPSIILMTFKQKIKRYAIKQGQMKLGVKTANKNTPTVDPNIHVIRH